MTGNIAWTGSTAATCAATRPPSAPPAVPAPAICPNRRFAVRGSKCSLVINQTPDPSNGPNAENCR